MWVASSSIAVEEAWCESPTKDPGSSSIPRPIFAPCSLLLAPPLTACKTAVSPHLTSPPSLSPPIRLQTAVSHGHVGPALRQSCPSLYWNLLLWLLSFALPTATLAHLGRADDGGGGVDNDLDGLLGLPALSARSMSQLLVGGGLGAGAALRAEAAELVLRMPSAAARAAVAAAAKTPASTGPPLVAA